MKTKVLWILFFVCIFSINNLAQSNPIAASNDQSSQSINSVDNISAELTKVSKSLQIFNRNFKSFLDHLPQPAKYSDKQQNMLLAFDILNRAEERVQILQKFQIELTDKQANVKTRLAQIEQDITPESIDRVLAPLGTTRTEEYRENRRKTLDSERNSLRQLAAQVNQNLTDTNNELREAAAFVRRLRDKILPQIEQEIANF